jgi:Ribbon-helix-helix protein, copG family
MTVRLGVKQAKRIAKLAELEGVDRSTVLRDLIDIGLDSPQVILLMRRPGAKGRGAMGSVIRAVAADERVKFTQSALIRAPSVEAELKALRAEEERAEAMAAFGHYRPKTS